MTGARVQDGRGAVQHGSEGLDRRRARPPRPGGARRAAVRASPHSRSSSDSPARASRAAAVWPSRSSVSTSHCAHLRPSARARVTSSAWHRSAARKAASACSRRPWPSVQHAPREVDQQRRGGLEVGSAEPRSARSSQACAASNRPCQTSISAHHRQRDADDRLGRPPVRLGHRDRLQASLPVQREGAPRVGRRRGEPGSRPRRTAGRSAAPARGPAPGAGRRRRAATPRARRCRGSSAPTARASLLSATSLRVSASAGPSERLHLARGRSRSRRAGGRATGARPRARPRSDAAARRAPRRRAARRARCTSPRRRASPGSSPGTRRPARAPDRAGPRAGTRRAARPTSRSAR